MPTSPISSTVNFSLTAAKNPAAKWNDKEMTAKQNDKQMTTTKSKEEDEDNEKR